MITGKYLELKLQRLILNKVTVISSGVYICLGDILLSSPLLCFSTTPDCAKISLQNYFRNYFGQASGNSMKFQGLNLVYPFAGEMSHLLPIVRPTRLEILFFGLLYSIHPVMVRDYDFWKFWENICEIELEPAV